MKLKEILAGLLIGATLFSCEKDDPEDIHEHEVFSNVILTLTSDEDGEVVKYLWHDENGDLKVDADELDNFGKIAKSTTYSAVISFDEEEHNHDHDDDKDKEGDEEHGSLDKEIFDEVDEHQIFFSAVKGLTVTYEDKDENGNPLVLGLETTFTTDAAYDGGDLTITLRHEPIKTAEGVVTGDITNAGGETDVEVTFSL